MTTALYPLVYTAGLQKRATYQGGKLVSLTETVPSAGLDLAVRHARHRLPTGLRPLPHAIAAARRRGALLGTRLRGGHDVLQVNEWMTWSQESGHSSGT
jgi:hypothetical protein